jgi:hypothetical protein
MVPYVTNLRGIFLMSHPLSYHLPRTELPHTTTELPHPTHSSYHIPLTELPHPTFENVPVTKTKKNTLAYYLVVLYSVVPIVTAGASGGVYNLIAHVPVLNSTHCYSWC